MCDASAIQMRDSIYQTETFNNVGTLETKLVLHHWQTIYFSMFANAVAFGTDKA